MDDMDVSQNRNPSEPDSPIPMTAEQVVAMKLRSHKLRSSKDISLTHIKRNRNRLDNDVPDNLYDVPYEVQKQS